MHAVSISFHGWLERLQVIDRVNPGFVLSSATRTGRALRECIIDFIMGLDIDFAKC